MIHLLSSITLTSHISVSCSISKIFLEHNDSTCFERCSFTNAISFRLASNSQLESIFKNDLHHIVFGPRSVTPHLINATFPFAIVEHSRLLSLRKSCPGLILIYTARLAAPFPFHRQRVVSIFISLSLHSNHLFSNYFSLKPT